MTESLQSLSPAAAVERLVTVPLNRNQRAALLQLVASITPEPFSRTELLKKLNRQDYAGASAEFARLIHDPCGEQVPELARERAAQRQLFDTPVEKPKPAPKPSRWKSWKAWALGLAGLAAAWALGVIDWLRALFGV